MAEQTLTIAEAVALAEIIRAAQETRKVARENGEFEPVYGTARSIGDANGGYLRADEDVRNGWLRVTTREGWEQFWPLAELVPEAVAGTFSPHYDWR